MNTKMSKRTRVVIGGALALGLVGSLAACSTEADTVSQNISMDADNFKVNRQITIENDITGKYIATIEGRCSLGNDDPRWKTTVTCKIGKDKYVKEIFKHGDNTSVMSLQSEPIDADPYRYKVIFKPEEVIPDIETHTSAGE